MNRIHHKRVFNKNFKTCIKQMKLWKLEQKASAALWSVGDTAPCVGDVHPTSPPPTPRFHRVYSVKICLLLGRVQLQGKPLSKMKFLLMLFFPPLILYLLLRYFLLSFPPLLLLLLFFSFLLVTLPQQNLRCCCEGRWLARYKLLHFIGPLKEQRCERRGGAFDQFISCVLFVGVCVCVT